MDTEVFVRVAPEACDHLPSPHYLWSAADLPLKELQESIHVWKIGQPLWSWKGKPFEASHAKLLAAMVTEGALDRADTVHPGYVASPSDEALLMSFMSEGLVTQRGARWFLTEAGAFAPGKFLLSIPLQSQCLLLRSHPQFLTACMT